MSLSLQGLADRAGARVSAREKNQAKRIRAIRDNWLREQRRKVLLELKKLPLDDLRRMLANSKKK